jgi:hypothetical protein
VDRDRLHCQTRITSRYSHRIRCVRQVATEGTQRLGGAYTRDEVAGAIEHWTAADQERIVEQDAATGGRALRG